ncbi:MAG: hypothetical protein KBB83_00575 [Alphaproteobacteria bacterium]|nr:hypothetical protein [Alphaproteobacteria bacterium]
MFSRFLLSSLISLSMTLPAISSGFDKGNNLDSGLPIAELEGSVSKQLELLPESNYLQYRLPQESERIVLNPLFADLQMTIGYRFRNSDLLILALRHSATDKGHTISSRGYERLEFFGDAVLEHIMRSMLWYDFPHINNGELRKTCSRLVDNGSSAKVSEVLRLPEISKELGLTPPSFDAKTLNTHGKADYVESLIAAIYEDGGIDAARAFIQKYWRSKNAPEELLNIFNKLTDELKAIKAKQAVPGSKQSLTRLNYDGKYNDSLSFLGEGVLGLSLKRFLCKQFPEASEGDLTSKYSAISSNQAIDGLCKAFHLKLKNAAMKKQIGELYIKDGLDETSLYILSYWTSLEAPLAIQNVIRKKAGSKEMIFFVKPEEHSSFLISADKESRNSVLTGFLESRDNPNYSTSAGSSQKTVKVVQSDPPFPIMTPTTVNLVKESIRPASSTRKSVKINNQADPDPIKTGGSVTIDSKKKAKKDKTPKSKKVRTPQQIAERKAHREILKIKREKRRAAKLAAQKVSEGVSAKKKTIASVDAPTFKSVSKSAMLSEEIERESDQDSFTAKKNSFMEKVVAVPMKKASNSQLMGSTKKLAKKQRVNLEIGKAGAIQSRNSKVFKLDPKDSLSLEMIAKENELAIRDLIRRGNDLFLINETEKSLVCLSQALDSAAPDSILFIEATSLISRIHNSIVGNIIRCGDSLFLRNDHEKTLIFFDEELSKLKPDSLLYQELFTAIANYKASLEIELMFGPEALWSDDDSDFDESYSTEEEFQPKIELRKEVKNLAKKKDEKSLGLSMDAQAPDNKIPKSLIVKSSNDPRKQEKKNKAEKKIDEILPLSFGFSNTPTEWTEWGE